jgi:hypothetical protein
VSLRSGYWQMPIRSNRKLSERMIGMCGFRNVLVYQYQELEVNILDQVANERWRDLVAFCQVLPLQIAIVSTA